MERLRRVDNGKESGVELTCGECENFYSGADSLVNKLWQWVLLQCPEDQIEQVT